MTYLLDDKISFDNTPNLDSFGRLRMSSPFTLFDSSQRFGLDANFTSNTVNGGTIAYNATSAITTMSVAANGDKAIRESNRVFAYQPGKSLLVMRTFTMSANSGLIQKIGYFDTNDGVYIEKNGDTISFVKRSSVSGSVLEVRVPKTEWNVDRLDGNANTTNPSGLTLDIDRTQILFMDFEWLGVGCVRCGFVIDGDYIVCHKFHHANQQPTANNDTTLPYMKTACLPLRAEIQSTGGSGTLNMICSTVLSEGGYELRGRPKSVGHALNAGRELTNINVLYPVLSIRLKSDRLNGIAVPKNFEVLSLNPGNFQYKIITGKTSGGSWANTGSDSIVEYNLTANSVNAGNTVHEIGYIASTNQAGGTTGQAAVPFKYQFERDSFSNTATEFIIAVTTTTNNPNVVCSLNWEEIT